MSPVRSGFNGPGWLRLFVQPRYGCQECLERLDDLPRDEDRHLLSYLAKTGSNAIGPETWSITSTATALVTKVVGPTARAVEATEGALGPVVPFTLGGATLVDAAVHVQCYFDPTLPPEGIPVAPK